jgi:hypothetical protein
MPNQASLARHFPLMLPTTSDRAYHGFLEVAVRPWLLPPLLSNASASALTEGCCERLYRTVPTRRSSSGSRSRKRLRQPQTLACN